jgi:hypothetical protein
MTITKKHFFSFIFLFIFGLAFVGASQSAAALDSLVESQIGLNDVGAVYGYSSGATTPDIRQTVGKIINIVLSLLGTVFLVLAIMAGFQYMTAAGNTEKTEKAMGTLKTAIIGLVIVLASWAISRFTIIMLSKAVNNSIDQTYLH